MCCFVFSWSFVPSFFCKYTSSAFHFCPSVHIFVLFNRRTDLNLTWRNGFYDRGLGIFNFILKYFFLASTAWFYCSIVHGHDFFSAFQFLISRLLLTGKNFRELLKKQAFAVLTPALAKHVILYHSVESAKWQKTGFFLLMTSEPREFTMLLLQELSGCCRGLWCAGGSENWKSSFTRFAKRGQVGVLLFLLIYLQIVKV